jgi:hypothetical protein
MSDPIRPVGAVGNDPTPVTAAEAAAQRLRERLVDRLRQQKQGPAPATGTAQPPAAGGASAASEPPLSEHRFPAYRTTVDPKSGLMTTDVLDTLTGEVVMRIPSDYTGEADAAAEDDAEGDGHPSRELKA